VWRVVFSPVAVATADVRGAVQLVARVARIHRQVAVSTTVESHSPVLDVARFHEARSCSAHTQTRR